MTRAFVQRLGRIDERSNALLLAGAFCDLSEPNLDEWATDLMKKTARGRLRARCVRTLNEIKYEIDHGTALDPAPASAAGAADAAAVAAGLLHLPTQPQSATLMDHEMAVWDAFRTAVRNDSGLTDAARGDPVGFITRHKFATTAGLVSALDACPTLARVALAVLTVPPGSVVVEREFSHLRNIYTHVRNRLHIETLSQMEVLRTAMLFGYVPSTDLGT